MRLRGDHVAKRVVPVLEHIQNEHVITMDTDWQFLMELQTALLLALQESEFLNDIQFQFAEKRLQKNND